MQPSYPTGASRTHTGWRALGKPACVVTAVPSLFMSVAIVIAVEPTLVGRMPDNRKKKTHSYIGARLQYGRPRYFATYTALQIDVFFCLLVPSVERAASYFR